MVGRTEYRFGFVVLILKVKAWSVELEARSSCKAALPTANGNVRDETEIKSKVKKLAYDLSAAFYVDVVNYCIDYFELDIPHYACLTGTVYNRWGGVVYSVRSSGFSWDGSNGIRGNQAPSGVYYYIVSYCVNGETITQKGNITLVR